MSKKFGVPTSLAVLLGCAISSASAEPGNVLNCSAEQFNVSGSVNTINISPSEQAGTISLTLTPKSGGASQFLEGEIYGVIQNQNQLQAFLNHYMGFSNGDTLTTNNDMAITMLPPLATEADGTACAFNVLETITDISGTGQLTNATGQIIARGSISFCSSNNKNSFELSGLLCLAD